MTYLDRVVVRDLLRSPGRIVLLLFSISVAFLMPAGIEMGMRSLEVTRASFAGKLHLADLEVRMLPEDISNLPVWDIPGLASVENRLLMPGTISRNGELINALLVFLADEDPRINSLELRAGRSMAKGDVEEALVERSAVEYLGFKLGERVSVQVGRKRFEQVLTGVAASPEFLLVAANPEYFLPEKGSLAIFYTRIARVYEELGFLMVNDLLFRYEPGADRVAVQRAVLAKLGGRKIERVIPRAEHISWKHIDIDMDIFGLFRPAISLVLALLAATLVILTFDGLVRRSRRELGTLKAIGYSGREIVRSYLIAALAFAVCGSVLGAFGAVGFRNVFLKVYAEAHGLAYLEQQLYPSVLLKSFAWILALCLMSALVATWTARRAPPIALMRPLLGTSVAAHGSTQRRLQGMPFALRLGIRNVLRSPRLTAVTVGGVALTVSVGLSYLICLDSMKHAMAESFGTQRWDRAVSFAYPVLDEEYASIAARFPGSQVEGFVRIPGTLAKAGYSQDVSILGIEPRDSLRGVLIKEGRLARGPDEIVIGADLAKRFTAGLGTKLALSVHNRERAMRVVGIKTDVLLGEVVLPIDQARGLGELADQATGVFVRLTDADSRTRFDAAVLSEDFVARITHHDSLFGKFMLILQDIRKLVVLVACVALLVGVIFIAANLSMTMEERSSELAVLFALGCARSSARWVVVVEVVTQTLLALLLAGPLTVLLSGLVNRLASEAWFEQTTFIAPAIMVAAAASVLVFTTLAVVLTFHRFWRSELLDQLRARAIQ